MNRERITMLDVNLQGVWYNLFYHCNHQRSCLPVCIDERPIDYSKKSVV